MSRRPFDGAAARMALRRKAHDLLFVAAATASPMTADAARAEAGELITLAARLGAIGDDPGPLLLAEVRRHVQMEPPAC